MPSEMPPRRSSETPEPALPQALPPFPEAGAQAGEAVQLVEMARDTSAADEQAAAGGRRRHEECLPSLQSPPLQPR